MDRNHSEPPSPSKVAAVGETWARLFGVPQADIAAVGRAYEARILDSHVWAIEGEWNGQHAIVARLGYAHVLATASGYRLAYTNDARGVRRPRGLQFPLQRKQAQQVFAKVAAYIACLDECNPARTPKIHLSSFSAWARELAVLLAREDLTCALCAVMDRKDADALYVGAGAKASRSYHKARVTFYLRKIGIVLRTLRTVMPAPVLTLLWSIGIPDFRLANWLMESESHRLYRSQALKTQPMLLPLALLAVPDTHDTLMGALAQIRLPIVDADGGKREVRSVARTLLDAIDAGEPWFAQLQQMLVFTCPGERSVSVANIRWLAGRSPRLLRWTRHCSAHLSVLLDVAARLPGNRQPTNATAWGPFTAFVTSLPVKNVPASFLKGMPCKWNEEPWLSCVKKMRSLDDAIRWALPGHHMQRHRVATHIWEWLLCHATLRQVLNYSDAAHAIQAAEEAATRREWQDRGESIIRWDAALPSGIFHHKKLVITELTTAFELEAEGRRLSHCIGGYAHACVIGESRCFSVRDENGVSLSSFELWRDTNPSNQQAQLCLAQHCAHENRAPSTACKEAVAAFLQAVRRQQIVVSVHWPRGEFPSDRRRIELTNRVREAVSRELFRRWPALRPFVLQSVDQGESE